MKNQLFRRLITITATGLACAAILLGNPVMPDTLCHAKAGLNFTGTMESDTYDNVDNNSDTDTEPGITPQNDDNEYPKPIM